jgi:hypothetical protein
MKKESLAGRVGAFLFTYFDIVFHFFVSTTVSYALLTLANWGSQAVFSTSLYAGTGTEILLGAMLVIGLGVMSRIGDAASD